MKKIKYFALLCLFIFLFISSINVKAGSYDSYTVRYKCPVRVKPSDKADIIKNGNNWISALCFAIDIYKGNYNNIMGVPLDEEERKKTLKPYLIELLNKYIDYNFKTNNFCLSIFTKK